VIRHFVTDRRRFGLEPDALVAAAVRAADRGADVIQIRERDLSDIALLGLVRALLAAVAGRPVRVLVNDRADVAIAAGAHGVHLRGDSPPASRIAAVAAAAAPARQAADRFIIGRSVHSLADVDAAVADGGCDYLMFGTVFPSAGKPPDHPVAGVERLAEACRRSTLPVIAIGGMTPEREPEIARAGAAGLAAIGWFM
jgi:thiamine-phosphate pyrophosphorylase